ncbi:MAG: TonB family protein [Bdellovibrionales bacterium]
MEKKNSFSFVSLSAFFHGALLLGLAVIPAMKMLPEQGGDTVEFVTAAGSSPLGQQAAAVAAVVKPEPIQVQPEVKKEVPRPVIKTAKVSAAKKVAQDQELTAKPSKKIVAIDASENELDADVAKAQAEAEAFAQEQKIKAINEEVAAKSANDEDVVSTTAEAAAAEAVSKEPQDELPPPKMQPVVQKLSDIAKAAPPQPAEQPAQDVTSGSGGADSLSNDLGATAGPSDDELRSYLDLKQLSGNKPPQYPSVARRNGKQGQVLLQYYVTQQGSVKDVRIEKSSGVPELDREAVRAVAQYRYVAGQEGWTSHPVVFSLKGQATPAASRLRTAGQSGGRGE